MIKRSSPGKARNILVACCKRKEGNRIWFIARELMRPYSTIRDWLVQMVQRGLGGRFDWKEEDPESADAQEDNGVDAQRPLEVRVRAGVVAPGHGKRDDQEGSRQARQTPHAAEDPAPPRPFVLQA